MAVTADRILIIHLKRIGDVLLTTPALAWLHQALPKAQIDFLIDQNFAGLLEGNKNIANIVLYPREAPWKLPFLMQGSQYDLIFDFLANGATAWACFLSRAPWRMAFQNQYPPFIHNLQIPAPQKPLYAALQKIDLIREALRQLYIDFKEPESINIKPEINITEAGKSYWKTVLQKSVTQDQPLIMMSPGSRRSSRRWSPQGYALTAQALAKDLRARVICLWGPNEKEEAAHIVARANHPYVTPAPELTHLTDLGAYLAHADCLITNCNGTKHMAVALNVPTLTIHMSSNPIIWNPPGKKGHDFDPLHPVLYAKDLWCIGCQKNQCPYNLECSSWIAPETVVAETEKLLRVKTAV